MTLLPLPPEYWDQRRLPPCPAENTCVGVVLCHYQKDRRTLSAQCLTGYTFLLQVLSEPWSLSTSQIPQFQICMFDPKQYPNHLGAGGGFGPVSPPKRVVVGSTESLEFEFGGAGPPPGIWV